MSTFPSSPTLVPLKRPTLVTEKKALSEFSDLSDTDKKVAILEKYPMPDHWNPPKGEGILGRLHRIVFISLCLCAHGRVRMNFVWASIKLADDGDESAWLEGRKRTSERQNNILVLAGILLATSSVFISTVPPRPEILDYTRWGPYFCICGAFGVLIGVISVCSVMILVTNNLTPTHAKDVLFGNRLHLYLTLIVSSYPPLWTGVATLLLAFGIQSGLWSAQNLTFKLLAAITLIQPFFIGFLSVIAIFRSVAVFRNLREQQQHKKEDDA